jgi:hypothetical protein
VNPGDDLQQVRKLLGLPPQQKPEPQSLWNSRAWELEHLFDLPVPQASTIEHDKK